LIDDPPWPSQRFASRGQEATPEIEAIRSFVIDRVPAELGLRRGSDRVGER